MSRLSSKPYFQKTNSPLLNWNFCYISTVTQTRERKVLDLSLTFYKCYLDIGAMTIESVPHPLARPLGRPIRTKFSRCTLSFLSHLIHGQNMSKKKFLC